MVRLISKEEEDEGEMEKTTTVEDYQISLGQTSQAAGRRSSSTRIPKLLTSATTVLSSQAEISSSCKRKQGSSSSGGAKLSVIERANDVQANLDPGSPSFVKRMLRSHVTREFWMELPVEYCSAHLPKQDVSITLVDENREEYLTRFLPKKYALGGGWRWFAVSHGLVEGDALVFQLIKPTTFQVYIIRAPSPGAVEWVIGLCTPRVFQEHNSIGKSIKSTEKIVRKRRKTRLDASEHPIIGKFKRLGISVTSVEFKDVKYLDSFMVVVNGLVVDSELTDIERAKYYELCRSQDAFLHDDLLEGINIKLACGAISQTVGIADAIKTSKLDTSAKDFAAWDKCLGGLEQLGMNVGFLRARVQKLFGIAYGSEEVVDPSQDRMITMKAKLAKLKRYSKVLDTEMEILKAKIGEYEYKFQEEVNSPW